MDLHQQQTSGQLQPIVEAVDGPRITKVEAGQTPGAILQNTRPADEMYSRAFLHASEHDDLDRRKQLMQKQISKPVSSIE